MSQFIAVVHSQKLMYNKNYECVIMRVTKLCRFQPENAFAAGLHLGPLEELTALSQTA